MDFLIIILMISASDNKLIFYLKRLLFNFLPLNIKRCDNKFYKQLA
mgnify:CR=1 FL=1